MSMRSSKSSGCFLVGNEGRRYPIESLQGYIKGPSSLIPY